MGAFSTPTRARNQYLPLQPRKNPDNERNVTPTTPNPKAYATVIPKPTTIFTKDGLEEITVERIQDNRAKRLGKSEINFRNSQNPLNDNIPDSEEKRTSREISQKLSGCCFEGLH